MVTNIFINERSLQAQYENPHDFRQAIVDMNQLFEAIQEFKQQNLFFKSIELTYKFAALKTQNFNESFAKIDSRLQQVYMQNMRE